MSNETAVESIPAPASAVYSAVEARPSTVAAAGRFGRLWSWFLGAGAVSIGIYQFLPHGVVGDICYVAVGLAGVTAIGAGLRLNQPMRQH